MHVLDKGKNTILFNKSRNFKNESVHFFNYGQSINLSFRLSFFPSYYFLLSFSILLFVKINMTKRIILLEDDKYNIHVNDLHVS